MKTIGTHNYYVYILTNKNKTVLYIGVTNNLKDRIEYHKTSKSSFTSKYNCFNLIYYERFEDVNFAIKREKELKGWNRNKKEELINSFNAEWKFLNNEI
ncbi:GIY-YIG nuclease family protein [uncultured Lutibacter sp.]|uniref:GIY-YIG nuclease family protein n=1 Tax=uncultured Lutibacter sp. TaxID=437739 RepID=UPI002615003B|nr:GIY-YIG nuclease family protein [uncultured Lutibacter sp.]